MAARVPALPPATLVGSWPWRWQNTAPPGSRRPGPESERMRRSAPPWNRLGRGLAVQASGDRYRIDLSGPITRRTSSGPAGPVTPLAACHPAPTRRFYYLQASPAVSSRAPRSNPMPSHFPPLGQPLPVDANVRASCRHNPEWRRYRRPSWPDHPWWPPSDHSGKLLGSDLPGRSTHDPPVSST